MMTHDPETQGINLRSEQSLHIALKDWYAKEGDRLEAEIDGFVIDIVRDDLLIEIQTKNFSALKRKLTKLLESHRVHLVHPIAKIRHIVKTNTDGKELSRRKSPKHGKITHVFTELVYIHHLMMHPNFSLEVLLVRDEEIRCNDGKGSWRRKGWSIKDRCLVEVVESAVFASAEDMCRLLPDDLPNEFTTADLAKGLKQPRAIAQKMAYCLSRMGVIEPIGKRRNAIVYIRR
jgi:hypothetical protein